MLENVMQKHEKYLQHCPKMGVKIHEKSMKNGVQKSMRNKIGFGLIFRIFWATGDVSKNHVSWASFQNLQKSRKICPKPSHGPFFMDFNHLLATKNHEILRQAKNVE